MKITKITFAAALLTCIAACSEDESVNKNIQSYDGETTPVQFEMNANTGNFYSQYREVSTCLKLRRTTSESWLSRKHQPTENTSTHRTYRQQE